VRRNSGLKRMGAYVDELVALLITLYNAGHRDLHEVKATRSAALPQPRPNDSSGGALIPERFARPAGSVTLQLRFDASPF
jgi:hypothetical protein